MSEDETYPPRVELPRQVGRVAMNWGHLEYLTSVTLWVAVNVSTGKGRLLTNGVALLTQWDQIEARLSMEDAFTPEMREWFKAWRKKADVLRVRRNEAVHSFWGTSDDPDAPYAALDLLGRKARVAVREDVVPGGAEALRLLASEIGEACIELAKWTAEIMGPVAPKWDPPRHGAVEYACPAPAHSMTESSAQSSALRGIRSRPEVAGVSRRGDPHQP